MCLVVRQANIFFYSCLHFLSDIILSGESGKFLGYFRRCLLAPVSSQEAVGKVGKMEKGGRRRDKVGGGHCDDSC